MTTHEKFSPAVFDPQKHLARDLESLGFPAGGCNLPRFVFVDAQAGQGKTTLVAQLLLRQPIPACWYRVDESDLSPACFLESLIAGLSSAFPFVVSAAVSGVLSEDLSTEQYPALLKQALDDLGRHLKTGIALVLDDVHLCQGSVGTSTLLHCLISHAPCNVHVVFISRENLGRYIQSASEKGTVVSLNNRSLAFSGAEIALLFNTLLQTPLTRKAVSHLRNIADGWIMGLLMTKDSLTSNDPMGIEAELGSIRLDRESVFDYLLQQVLGRLPAKWREILLTLSVLDDIPVELARLLTGCPEVDQILQEMAHNNHFIRALNKEQSAYALHHLFREGLRQYLSRERSQRERQRLHKLAASWYQERQKLAPAVRFFVLGEDFHRAEQILRDSGLDLKSQHRLSELRLLIGGLPGEVLNAHPWFSYYLGLGLMTEDPPQALPSLAKARENFAARNDVPGELLANAQIMLLSIACDGNFSRGSSLLGRTMELFEGVGDSLPPALRGHVANVFVLANTFFRFDPDQVDRFFSQGLDIALREKLVNLEAEARMARLYYLILSGDWQRCRLELETARPLLQNPLCNLLHKGAICLAFMSFLKESGDFAAYARQRELFRTFFDARLRQGSVYETYVLLWDLHIHMARGDRLRADETVLAATGSEGVSARPHLNNLVLQQASLLAAEAGRTDLALAMIRQAQCLRDMVGGDYFRALNNAFYGAAFDLLGKDDQALRCFQLALQSESALIQETAWAFRARFYLRRGNEPAASADLTSLLCKMQASGHEHFHGWQPKLVRELLAAAARLNLDVTFAQRLARNKFDCNLLADGTLLPLLYIETLGPLRFKFEREDILLDSDFADAQRQLLALLLSSATLSSPQERLQSQLWPDSDAKRARNNFDKLLSRLRKSFHAALGVESFHYLQLKNGILSLCNCQIDVQIFSQRMNEGMAHYRRENFWQAEISLQQAVDLYQGEFLAGIVVHDEAERLRRELLTSYHDGVLALAAILNQWRMPDQAVAYLKKALQADPIHDDINKQLYHLMILHDTPARAQAVLKDYETALRREDFSAQEIAETLEGFWA